MEMKLLTGVVLDMRRWKLSDMEMLLNSNSRTFLSALLKIFEATTVAVLDHGIYGTFSWAKAYEGDLYDALWQARAMSVSPTYTFALQCPNRRCRNKIEFEKPIEEIRRNPVRADVMEVLLSGSNKVTLPWSRGKFTFLIPTAEQAIALMNSNRGASQMTQKGEESGVDDAPDKMTTVLKTKLLVVEEDGQTYEASSLRRWIEDIDLMAAGELFAELEDATFGVDTGIHVSCGECGNEWDAEVPMTKGFFLPRKTRP